MSRDERLAAFEAALVSSDHRAWARPWIANRIVKAGGGWRFSKLLEASRRELAERATKLALSDRDSIERLLRALYLGPWIGVQVDFFDRTGVKHQNGLIVTDEDAPDAGSERVFVSAASITSAVPAFLASNGDRGLLYLLALHLMMPERWAGIPEALAVAPGIAGESVPTAVVAPLRVLEPAEPQPSPHLRPMRDPDLSGLDDLLILAVITGAAAVQGHPSLEDLRLILDEYAHQNTSRHQSWYLVGFRDALASEEVRQVLDAENEARRRWYLAGFMDGLARAQRHEELLSLLTTQPSIASLNHWRTAVEVRLGERIALAMAELRRLDDLVRLVSPALAGRSRPVYQAIRSAARDALTERRLPEALTLLETALAARADGRAFAGENDEHREIELLELQRHMAHCHRLMGSFDRARIYIDELLPSLDVRDAERSSMLRVDLGLMAASLRELSDLHLPAARSDFAQRAKDLLPAEAHWQHALGTDPDLTYGHAHYALGFLFLIRERFAEARVHIEQAVHAFLQRPDVYARGTLVSDAKAHAALASCLEFESGTAVEASARDLAEAVLRGFRLPTGLSADLLAAFSMVDQEVEQQFLDAVLQRYRSEQLAEFEVAGTLKRSRALRQAFRDRAGDATLPIATRVSAAYAVLPELLSCGEREDALGVIDVVYEAALDGVGSERFLEFTQVPGALSPAFGQQWDADWQRAQVLRAAGRPDDAVVVLSQAFLRALSRGGAHALADAEEIAELCEQMVGATHSVCCDCRRSLAAVAPPESRAEARPKKPVRVLFVGGNEVQAQYDEVVRADIGTTAPWITVTFYHTYWKQQWNAQVDDVSRLLHKADAVVLSRFVRTTFGEHVRALCEHRPWRLCGGSGKGSIRQSILLAASLVSPAGAGQHASDAHDGR